MKTRIALLSVLIFTYTTHNVFAQGEANFWYFGDSAGLDFNSGTPVALTNGVLSTFEGCATISTSAGALRFYTDGSTVWNNIHIPMPNGTGLLGSYSSTQSAVIVPKPGNPNIYYIFTSDETGGPNGLKYSEVDMTLAGGLGDITANKNVPLTAPVAEKITAVKKANNIDIWVIAHTFTTDTFFVYSVTSAGVNNVPLISTAGTSDLSLTGVGYLKASADGSKLVQALSNISTVDVLNFNTSTGAVSSNFSFPFNAVYGVEFSPDASRLYAASWLSDSLYQYNMTLSNSAAIISSGTVVGISSSLGALQLGPDNRLYLAKGTQGTLDCVTNPNTLGIGCGLVNNAVNLSGKICQVGLPNFIQTYFNHPSISYVNNCVGDTTYFLFSDTSAIDSAQWNFGDPVSSPFNVSTLLHPGHIFSSAGTYNVVVVTHSGSITDTLHTIVVIKGLPVFTIGNDTSMCPGSSLVLDPGPGYSDYLWQNSSTNQTFTASAPGIYYVSVSNNCETATDTIQIALGTITVTVNNTSICNGQTATLIANGADTYSWSFGATATSINTATAAPQSTTTYTVTGVNGNCTDTALSQVIVFQLPVASAGNDITVSSCSSVQLNASGGITYSWSPYTGLSCFNCSDPVALPTTTTDYCVTVSDSNNCTNTDCIKITVAFGDFTIPTAFSPNNDGHNDLFILHGFENCTSAFSFAIFDRWGEKVFETNSSEISWDGIYKGKPLNAGVFVYSLNATLLNGEKINRKGNISLIR